MRTCLSLYHDFDCPQGSPKKQCELCVIETCGVGIELDRNSSGQWIIAAIRPGGPADLSRLLNPGDIVVSVEWNSIEASNLDLLFKRVYTLTVRMSRGGVNLR